MIQQEVYETLKSQLLAGRFRPGQKLGEQRLAIELGVNRNPVREALLKLAAEGLVQRQAGLGCRAAKVDVELFRDVWELRESVEGMAARLAAKRIKPVQLIRLEHQLDLIRRLSERELNSDLIDADNAFHQMIVEFSGNKALREVWRQYLARIVAMQMIMMPARYIPPASALQETVNGHAQILEALQAHDAVAAERLVRHHIDESLNQLLDLWNEQQRERKHQKGQESETID